MDQRPFIVLPVLFGSDPVLAVFEHQSGHSGQGWIVGRRAKGLTKSVDLAQRPLLDNGPIETVSQPRLQVRSLTPHLRQKGFGLTKCIGQPPGAGKEPLQIAQAR